MTTMGFPLIDILPSIKLTSNKSIDLGEGILRLFYSYDKKK